MSAEEFGLWLEYRPHDTAARMLPLLAELLSAVHNGRQRRKDGRAWRASDFYAEPSWEPPTVAPQQSSAPGPDMAAIRGFFTRVSGT
jgi:hypothetical protein